MTLAIVGWLCFMAGFLFGAAWAGRKRVVIHWVNFQAENRFSRINVTHDAERN
jgi:hypothetical protein